MRVDSHVSPVIGGLAPMRADDRDVRTAAGILSEATRIAVLTGAGMTELSTYSFLTPMIAMISGWWLLGEVIDVRSFIGSGLIIIGIYLVQKS